MIAMIPPKSSPLNNFRGAQIATWRAYRNSSMINRAASSDWLGPNWYKIEVAAW
jgi:hypothetical protein